MRVQSLLKIWVAVVCALGAGFSGDMIAHHSGHGTHAARHSRASGQRTRGLNRDGVSDHSVEVDLPRASDSDQQTAEVAPSAPVAPEFHFVAWVAPFDPALPRTVDVLAPPPRGPPALS